MYTSQNTNGRKVFFPLYFVFRRSFKRYIAMSLLPYWFCSSMVESSSFSLISLSLYVYFCRSLCSPPLGLFGSFLSPFCMWKSMCQRCFSPVFTTMSQNSPDAFPSLLCPPNEMWHIALDSSWVSADVLGQKDIFGIFI